MNERALLRRLKDGEGEGPEHPVQVVAELRLVQGQETAPPVKDEGGAVGTVGGEEDRRSVQKGIFRQLGEIAEGTENVGIFPGQADGVRAGVRQDLRAPAPAGEFDGIGQHTFPLF